MSLVETRRHQMFPVLDLAQIETARRFASGAARSFAPGEIVYRRWRATRAGLARARGHRSRWWRATGSTTRWPSRPTAPARSRGEVSQLAGRAALATGRAGPQGCTALPFDAAHLRALVVGSAELGEVIMRAFILRRVGLIQEGGAGSVLVGRPGAPDLVRLQGFLARNGYPYTVLDASADGEGRAVVERFGVQPEELPLMVCPNGTVLKRPTDAEAGGLPRHHPRPRSAERVRRRRGRGRARPVSRPRSTPRPRACRCSCSTSAPSAARPGRRLGSRTISAFPPASPARHWPGAPSTRR